MQLFDPNRPKLPNLKPAWSRDHIAINNFEIFPLESGNLEISIWLPIKDSAFTSMRFTKIFSFYEFGILLNEFVNNPEETCEKHFTSQIEILQPQLTNQIRFEYDPNEESKPKQKQNKTFTPLNLDFDSI